MYLSEHDAAHKNKAKMQIKDIGASWIAAQRFWLFGTATYYAPTSITRHKIEGDLRLLFNATDRKLLTHKELAQGKRLERLVFIESGRTRDCLHAHFYIKGTHWKHYRQLQTLIPQIWQQKITKAKDILMLDNLETSYERKGYTWKELDELGTECFYPIASHLSLRT